jgi:hypothetical protein
MSPMGFRIDWEGGEFGRPNNLITGMVTWPAKVADYGRLLIVVGETLHDIRAITFIHH